MYPRTFFEADSGAAAAGAGNAAEATGAGAGQTPPAAGASAGTVVTAPPESTGEKPWYSTVEDADLRGWAENKGFKTPAEALKAAQSAEKFLGVPKEQLLRLPKEAGDAGWKDVWKRLGTPEKVDGYELKPSEKLGGDEKFMGWAKETFLKHNLTKTQAESLVADWNKYQETMYDTLKGEHDTKSSQEFDGLKKEWGNAYDPNVAAASAAVRQFGLSADQVDKMQDALGYGATMKLLHNIGKSLGEGKFVSGSGNPDGRKSPDAAQNEINALMKDSAFRAKVMAGDVDAKAKWDRLIADSVGGA